MVYPRSATMMSNNLECSMTIINVVSTYHMRGVSNVKYRVDMIMGIDDSDNKQSQLFLYARGDLFFANS